MESRHILSYALIIVGILLFLVLLLANEWFIGLLVGLIFVIVGVIFRRRGK